MEGFSDIYSNSHTSPSKLGFGSEDSAYSEEEDWKETMCKIDVAIMKIEETIKDCTEILTVRNPVDNLSRDTSEDSEFEESPMETFTAEVVRSDIKPEVSG